MRSLTKTTHLLNYNANVLRKTYKEQKSLIEQKSKSSFNFDF